MLAEKLVTERLGIIKDDRLVVWLANRLKERGDLAGSLELEEKLFWKYPIIDKYENFVNWQCNLMAVKIYKVISSVNLKAKRF